ncbi:MAG: transcription-repair coupling factor [Christensenellales bacterium]
MSNNVSCYFEHLFETPKFQKIRQNCGIKDINISGLSSGEKAVVLSSLGKKFVYVASDLIEANATQKVLDDFGISSRIIYSAITSPVLTMGKIDDIQFDALNKLYDFLNDEVFALIVLPSFLTQRLPSRTKLFENQFCLKVDDEVRQKDFENMLIHFGFSRAEGRGNIGEFCVRGDTIEVCACGDETLVRIEFFDDVVEKIKICDKTTLSLIKNVDKYYFHPTSIFFLEKEQKNAVLSKLFEQKSKNVQNSRLDENLSGAINIVENNFCMPAFMQPYLIGFHDTIATICTDEVFAFDETKKIKDAITGATSEFFSGFLSLVEGGELLKEHKDFLLTESEIFSSIPHCLFFDNIIEEKRDIEIDFQKAMTNKYTFDFSSLLCDLKIYKEKGKFVVLFAGGKTSCENLKNYMLENGLYFDDFSQSSSKGIFLSNQTLSISVGFADENFVAIATPDLIKKSTNFAVANKKKVFYLPKVGDYVVHVTHGIGKCVGIEKLKLSSVYKDYFIIEYKGGDRLYVPSEQANSISAYLGGEAEPKLNKIGGLEFRKAKEKVYKSVKEMAGELVKLYSAREQKHGFKFSEDGYLQAAFEEAFPYDETEDQIVATNEIKKDMQSTKIMDRLLCGDVGYGKTEVAMRAAYKAVIDGKQVAFMCPTTILSQQHFNTCQNRFKDFMCRVEVLNRFKTPKQQKEILEKLKRGEIDVICGTHRLLGKDVEFKDLGLLILDEEQRFGVADKEKIKKLKNDVDVLALSATPIPRTLHMSLSGIRDISILSTPPKDRLPVQTYVTEFSPMLLKDACLKEIARGGQILIVYNRVDKINEFAAFVKNLLPGVDVGVAHGQMDEKLLEQAIFKLYNREYQVFISTTLIENGIDLPLANTLFVLDSDRLGLSQLYQLRGRIGRGNRLAYAYFTFDGGKKLTEQAFKRLEAIMQFRELGSGFKIAMRDLEIRGAGNVLGKEQHGQMQKVGYDLYCKILKDAVGELSGEHEKPKRDVKLDIAVEAYIEPDYIGEEDLRIKIYNSISELTSVEQMRELEGQLENSFGELAVPAKNLLRLAVVKNLAEKHEISRIFINNSNFSIFFYEKEKIIEQNVVDVVSAYNKFCVLKFSPLPIIEVNIPHASCEEKLNFLLGFLSKM